MRIRVKILFAAIAFLIARSAGADDGALAVNAVRKTAKGCENCAFFAAPGEAALIRRHGVLFVSTLDRVPPPFWAAAVSPKGRVYLLGGKSYGEWNKMIGDEDLNLKSDEDLNAFAKTFLRLSAGRAALIETFLPAEAERIRKKTNIAPAAGLQIVRSKKIFSLSFPARKTDGGLQLWDLIVEPSGRIQKADVSEY